MPRITLINPTTSSVATGVEVEATAYEFVCITADNLATTEEVDIQVDGKAVTNEAGTVLKLTATIPLMKLTGGVRYTVLKDLTAVACGVYMWPSRSVL